MKIVSTRAHHLAVLAAAAALPTFLSSCGGGGSSDPGKSGKEEAESSVETKTDFPPQDVTAEMEKYYQSKPDFFVFKTIADLPADLQWTDNGDLPEIGSPNAKKGGTAHSFIDDFPRTLRIVGPDSNGSFRNYLLDDVIMNLAHRHPNTFQYMPGTAEKWAVDAPNKTVYVKIDPKATWSDGVPLTSDDFFFMFFFYQSAHIQAPWYNNWYGEKYTRITKYDDKTFSVTVPEAKPDMDGRVLELNGTPAHFYKELGTDFLQRYQWRFQPTTGAYVVRDEDVVKGRSIALTRHKDWWAKDKKQWRYRYNPDRIEFAIIRDTAKAFEEFKKGTLDGFGMNLAEYHYNKLPDDHELVKSGWVHKNTFYNDTARPTYGLWINRAQPVLDNRDVRVGIQHAMNWTLVLEKYFRGDYSRMRTTADGFREYTHPTLKARDFDVNLALEAFAKAGFTQRDRDGILMNASGQRLSFSVTTGYEHFKDMLAIMQQEARKAGLEIKLDILDSTAAWKKAQEKNHEIVFSAFGVFPELYPRYWESWHSVNAFDENKKPKTQTNNLTATAIPELDKLIDAYDKSDDAAAMVKMAHQMEEMIHEDAAFVPGFVQPFYRTATWRWVHYPEDFNVKISDSPGQYFLSWIDDKEREETLAARKAGTTFPPMVKTYDQYKVP
jgi:microcin C transport system substrate-binding protein